MSKMFLGGFVLIATLAVGAVDYINQARRAGIRPGAFAVSDYVDTIAGRATGRTVERSAAKPAEVAADAPATPASGTAAGAVAALSAGTPPAGDAGTLAAIASAASALAASATPPASPESGGLMGMLGGFLGGSAALRQDLAGKPPVPTQAEAVAAFATAASALAASEAAAPPASPESGGIMGMLGGFAPGQRKDAGRPPVRLGGFSGNCTLSGGIKRCSLSGN